MWQTQLAAYNRWDETVLNAWWKSGNFHSKILINMITATRNMPIFSLLARQRWGESDLLVHKHNQFSSHSNRHECVFILHFSICKHWSGHKLTLFFFLSTITWAINMLYTEKRNHVESRVSSVVYFLTLTSGHHPLMLLSSLGLQQCQLLLLHQLLIINKSISQSHLFYYSWS